METWALLLFLCSRTALFCETIEKGHYKTREACIVVLDRELAKARETDQGSGAICKLVEEKGVAQ